MFILSWKYYDGSQVELVRVYEKEERALQDYELVKSATDKCWYLTKVPTV